MSKLTRLLSTTAVRLSLKYSFLYILMLGIAFIILYVFITNFVEDQIKVTLIKESKKMEKIYRKEGIKGVKRYILAHEQFKGEDHMYYLLVGKNGRFIAGDLNKWPSGLNTGKSITNVWISEKDIIGKVMDGDGYWPTIAVKLSPHAKILIAQGVKGTEDLRETLFAIMAVIFVLIVILTLTLGFMLGKSVLWHVDNIRDACKTITEGNLSKRIPISKRKDEFDVIGNYINNMLDELEKFINHSKEASTSIAHDLRTPLNRIRNKIEKLILSKESPASHLPGLLHEIDKLIKMINSVLEIAQIETGALRKDWERVNIYEVLSNAINFYAPFAEEKHISMTLNLQEGHTVVGNKQLISQAVINIIDNAIKYTPPKGKIEVSLEKRESNIVISICDNGPGIEPKNYNRITEKFVRLDQARTKEGNGLGLSLVKAIVNLHHGELSFKDNKPGLCVELKFKAA